MSVALASRHSNGEAICTHLKQIGLLPVWMETDAGDRIAIGFEFISDHPTWTKAFSYDAIHATPDAFITLINEWKNKVRRDIVEGTPSTVVRNLIEAHGAVAVLDAVEDTRRGH